MTTAKVTTPGAPGPEPLRAKELKNRACIIRPTATGATDGNDGTTWEFVEADVWMLDRAGVERHETGVRISWKRAMPQLENNLKCYIACRPKETESGGVILVDLEGDTLAVTERVVSEIDGDGEEPY